MIYLLLAAFIALCACAQAQELPAKVELICIDPVATGYATFQSHNQKVVANRYGIFESHIRTRTEDYLAQTWRLSRSTDGGKTFTTLIEQVDATNPPPIETDAAGNIYLVRVDWKDGHAYLYRFLAEKDFKDPTISLIPNGQGGKYALALDEGRRQLYYFSNNNTFHIIGFDGEWKGSYELTKDGAHGCNMYPQVCVDADGNVHAAWTTQKHGVYMYWDIHHVMSTDGGKSWRNLDGTAVATPVTVDDTGPALLVSRDDEFEVHTFLANMLAHGGKVHLTYLAQSQPQREHYLRYDIATGKRDVDLWPEFKGETIKLAGLDGFFASRANDPKAPLYCVMSDNGRIACLESTDNGATWHDYARSDKACNPYSIGGFREITDDGYIIGTFTDQQGAKGDIFQQFPVYLIKIKAQ